MLRKPLTTRAISMALALSAGAALGTVALTSPALAQRQQERQQQGPSLSRDFQPVYQAVEAATNTTRDFAAAKAQVPALLAAIASDYDRFFAGNILLQLGTRSTDKALQKQGLELMLQSGQATPADNGLFHYFLGGFAFDAGDYATALREGQASLASGFQGNFAEQQDPWLLVADSYFKLGRNQEGVAFLKSAMEQRSAAGQPVRDQWLARSIAAAYEANLVSEAADLSAQLVRANPTPNNWMQGLQVVGALMQSDAQARLDVLRLMALTDSLSQRGEFEMYVAVLDPRVLASEVGQILDAGVRKGVFTTGDPFYAENKRVADSRVAAEAALAADYAGEAASASDGRPAFNAGDVYLSLGDFAKAEQMFALALEKGGVDRGQALTRLGISQVRQGKNAEAKATFGQVTGTHAPVARMWGVYAESRA